MHLFNFELKLWKVDLQWNSPRDTILGLIFWLRIQNFIRFLNPPARKKKHWEAIGKAIPFYTLNFKSHHRYEMFCRKERERFQDGLTWLIGMDAGTHKVTFEMTFADNTARNCISEYYAAANHAFTILQALTLALLLLGMLQTLLCFQVPIFERGS